MKGIYGIPAVLALAAQPLMAEMVFAQASPTLITGIQVQSEGDGIRIGIETESGSPPRFLPPSPNYRTVLVVDLLDAQLSGRSLSESNPAPGILSVNLDRRTENSVRLTIIGSEQLPAVNVQAGGSWGGGEFRRIPGSRGSTAYTSANAGSHSRLIF
ncbi:MAG: AMIN domain-containing protein, partial [Synechococcaceae cyanobacterium SM2_3_2]|nr:AMIN domain-containing protein [Synechococcaceae cyanobacterium SM2_3_2]